MEQQGKRQKKHKGKKAEKKERKRRRYASEDESDSSGYGPKRTDNSKKKKKKKNAKHIPSTPRRTLTADKHEPKTQRTYLQHNRPFCPGEVIPQPIRNLKPSVDGLEFDSWDSFETYWNQYQEDNLISYRCRDSATTQNFNSRHPNNQIPVGFRYAFKKYACKLGCRQKSRGTGKRTPRSDRFRGCVAKIRAVVRPSAEDSGKWVVMITNENNCHCHNTNKALYAALKSCGEIIDDSILDQLDAFAETNTSTKHITEYVSRKMDLPFTSQQIRNLINSRLGSSTTEERIKDLITDFVGDEGNSCLLIQDDWGYTSGMVVQSSAQKEIFKRWGDNLVLDWTHNTNNIGYYLGSLIVTVPTGRGVSVLDFLCINQQKEMLAEVLKFFKGTNAGWSNVESLVIDKDFAEMAALKTEFPEAEIFLCQFHALRSIRRMMASRLHFVPIGQRKEVENLFRDMMMSVSYERYCGRRAQFVKRVDLISSAFVGYFKRYWDSCSYQWSNYGRAQRFSAGNSTTNRIEASWNQYKQLIGKKIRMDKCLRVVFKQQSCVLRDFVHHIGTQDLRAVMLDDFASELGEISKILSCYCFKREQLQWRRHVIDGVNWIWHHFVEGSCDVYQFSGSSGGSIIVYWRSEAPCTCNCFFYVSTRLPCQHIFNVMQHRNVDGFKVAQLQTRWSMKEAETVEPLLTRTIHRLGELGEIQGPRRLPIRLNSARRRIGYVKIRRGEVCLQPVLCDCEKYNIVQAELSPLVDAMQRLPSHEFYERFSDLRGLLSSFKEQWGLTAALDTSTDDTADEIESDQSENENDLLDEINGALSSRRTLSRTEPELDLAAFLVDAPSQISQPDLEFSEASQSIIDDIGGYTVEDAIIPSPRRTNTVTTHDQFGHPVNINTEALDCDSERSVSLSATTNRIAVLHQHASIDPVEVAQLPTTVRSRGSVVTGVDIIKLHQPPVATSTSNNTQQKNRRRGIVHLQRDCPVDVESLFKWAQHFSDKDRVCEIIDRYPVLFSETFLQTRRPDVVMRIAPTSYNFLVPRGLLSNLSSAFANWEKRKCDPGPSKKSHDLDTDSAEPVPVVTLATHGEFTRSYTVVVKQIYEVCEVIHSYQDDLEWVRGHITAEDYAVESPLHIASVMPSMSKMAQQVAQLLSESWLARKFMLRPGAVGKGGFLPLAQVVGHLAGKARLSDSVMHCALQYIFSHHHARCYTVDPIHVERGEFKFPATAMAAYRHVIVPVFIRALKHWVIQIITLPISTDEHLTLVLYDPLGIESHHELLKDKWNSYTMQFLQKWHARDCACTSAGFPDTKMDLANENIVGNAESADASINRKYFSPLVRETLLLHPRQPDAVSCGVLCIALAFSYIDGNEKFQETKVVKHAEVDAIRLCIMWQVLCDCDERHNVTDATFSV